MKRTHFSEPPRNIPIHEDADVIVCGAGPAGIAAAISAARAGARTRLFEMHGALGGTWTNGLLTYIFDFRKPGIAREIVRGLDKLNARRTKSDKTFVYEPEEMKWLVENMCIEAGIRIRLHTTVVGAYKEGRRLTTIVTESKSEREAWRAPVFIDTTGDGDLCARAGCGWDIGREGDGIGQPWTLNALAVVRDIEAIKDFVSFYPGNKGRTAAWQGLREEIRRAGFEPSYGRPTLFHVHENLVLLMINHEYGVQSHNADQMTEATIRARREIHAIVRGLNKLGGVWEGMRLVMTGEQIGIRDGRRIHGRYTVTQDDLVSGREHEDAVCMATFNVDIHAANKESNKKAALINKPVKPYDIPLRALIPKDVDGLMMAGRCISGDFISLASYRVTGNAVAMGESAGIVAARAAKNGKMPHEIEWKNRILREK